MTERVKLSHGGGGTMTRDLVERVFLERYGGTALAAPPGRVVARTPVGGRKVVEMPYGEGLPRIC